MMKCIRAVLVALLIACGAFVAYIYSGVYNVAATAPDGLFTNWIFGTTRERSIAARIGNVRVPKLSNLRMIREGFRNYDKMCVSCHLAPGIDSSDLRSGLNPRPPSLARSVPYSTPAQLFWIIKNGIKMTGMPAWGRTQSNSTIWTIVAFLEKLPSLTPAEYAAMKAEAPQVSRTSTPLHIPRPRVGAANQAPTAATIVIPETRKLPPPPPK